MKMVPFRKKRGKKVKSVSGGVDTADHKWLLKGCKEDAPPTTPTGYFVVYVGEEHQRFVVPTRYLSHPLFKMLLEKAYNEFGFNQLKGLVVPCSVSTFQAVVHAVECGSGKFDFATLFEEFL